jgi:hypothetical protein
MDAAWHWLETASAFASERAAPVLRTAETSRVCPEIELVGIPVSVVEVCSRSCSAWVLFMTNVLAARLCLKSP